MGQKAHMWGKRPMGVLSHFAHILVETIMLPLITFLIDIFQNQGFFYQHANMCLYSPAYMLLFL